MKEYALWLTTLTPLYFDNLSSELIKSGYLVSSLSGESPILTDDNYIGCIYALKLSSSKESVGIVYKEIAEIIAKEKILYNSLIISEFTVDCVWASSNVMDKKLTKKSNILN